MLQVLGDDQYLVVARKALTFVRQKLYNEEKQMLLRCWRMGAGLVPGFHMDYAYFIQVPAAATTS